MRQASGPRSRPAGATEPSTLLSDLSSYRLFLLHGESVSPAGAVVSTSITPRAASGGTDLGSPRACPGLTPLAQSTPYGGFCFGRTHTCRKAGRGFTTKPVPRGECRTVLRDFHPGYLSWEEYEQNQQRLRAGAQAYDLDRRDSTTKINSTRNVSGR